uniref:unspecific monooxygenase n=1 Tax=Anabas testudineus TaxID=64144 RepID=A0A7N6AKW1_ANATE
MCGRQKLQLFYCFISSYGRRGSRGLKSYVTRGEQTPPPVHAARGLCKTGSTSVWSSTKKVMGFLPFFSLETWILLIAFVCLFVIYGYWTYGVFEKLGIPGPKPVMYWGTVARYNKVHYLDDIECAQKYGRVWGMYELRRPMLAVMDPDMLKQILVKECFTYFTNRRNLRLNGDLYDAVSTAEDHQWRRIRNIISPFFTSGHIKELFSIMKHHSHKLVLCLQSKVHNDEVIDIKDFFGPYSLDVMASCALSVDMDSINNPSSPFITHATNLFRFSKLLFAFQGTELLLTDTFFFILSAIFWCFPIFLPVLDLLGFSFFSKSSTAFFKSLLSKIQAQRKGSFVISLSVATGLTDHEIISQATMFVFAGFETSATTLVFVAYNLARNPDVMKRLLKEIDATFPNKAPVQYEALMKMEYLDSVVTECLRLYPPIPRLERLAKETVQINGITIPKDMTVMIPVYALHRDPELWPEPEVFKPDRFSKENKPHINPYTYLPFGAGPRNCLGTRFALVVVKLALVEVLQNFTFSVCEETEIPLQMEASAIIRPIRPIKLRLVARSTTSGNVDKCD